MDSCSLQLGARARERDAADLEHVRGLRELQRDVRVLLDDEDGEALRSFRSLMMRKISVTSRGARPSDGSSSSSSRGRCMNARASASICCSPPLSVPGLLVAALLDPREVRRAPRARSALIEPRLRVGAEPQVLPDGQLGERAAALGHVRDAEARDVVGAAAAERLARRSGSRRRAEPCSRSRAASSSCRRRSRRARRRSGPRRRCSETPCSACTGP